MNKELLEQIQTINDLEELLGDKLHISEDLKDVDLFNLE